MSFLKALSPAAMVASNPGGALKLATGSGLFPGLSLGAQIFGHHPSSSPPPSAAATGLGHVLGADPSRVSSIANSIGNAANGIATAGGASAGYQAPQDPGQMNNHLQMIDPEVLRAIYSKFGGYQR